MKYKDTSRPCYNCPERLVTSDYNCHSDCPRYKADIQAEHELNEQVNRKRYEEHMMNEVKIKGIEKVKKREHR